MLIEINVIFINSVQEFKEFKYLFLLIYMQFTGIPQPITAKKRDVCDGGLQCQYVAAIYKLIHNTYK